MTAVERWVRRLTVSAASAVAAVFVATTALGAGLTWPALVAIVLLVCGEAACLVAPAGRLRPAPTAVATSAGVLLPLLGSAGDAPGPVAFAAGVWYVVGALALILLLLWGGRPAGAWTVLTVLVVHTFLWGGLAALASMGVLGMGILLAAITAARSAIVSAETAMERDAAMEREAIQWRTLQDAYHRERQDRLAATAAVAGPMLEHIAASGGRLTDTDRAECRLLEQTIRDEIRGRLLLNAAVRKQVMAHRRRGATVQVNDDGGLDDEGPAEVDELLHRVAGALEGITSDRIVIRTLPRGSACAISVVATTSDPIAAALGLEGDDDRVDLWLELPRPSLQDRVRV